jgi:CRP-like cAMP-binding protein
LLDELGENVHIMELQGELCFATCEIFMRKISSNCNSLILSLKKCITIDDGALNLLMMLDEEFQQNNKILLITEYEHLDLLITIAQKGASFLQFTSLNDAVLHIEETLLSNSGYQPMQEPIQLVDQQLLSGLSHKEIFELASHLKHRQYAEGETIIKKGSSAEEIYFLESGQVAIQDRNGDNKDFTLAVINAGNSFGEMALLDKKKRSANVKALTNVSCYVMVYDKFDQMESLSPIRVKILTNLGVSLSTRLRAANQEIASFT